MKYPKCNNCGEDYTFNINGHYYHFCNYLTQKYGWEHVNNPDKIINKFSNNKTLESPKDKVKRLLGEARRIVEDYYFGEKKMSELDFMYVIEIAKMLQKEEK